LKPKRVLFVCTGNICRSPSAEGVFRAMVEKAGLSQQIQCESAGTHGYHIGDPPDLRAIQAARGRGYDLSAQRARKVAPQDFNDFDLMLAMDQENMRALALQRPKDARIQPQLMLEHVNHTSEKGVVEVADPYYGGGQGFETMLDVIEAAAAKLLASLTAESK
jgi:protein-tyrosine phosphatase